jgi:hypothetical protein
MYVPSAHVNYIRIGNRNYITSALITAIREEKYITVTLPAFIDTYIVSFFQAGLKLANLIFPFCLFQ